MNKVYEGTTEPAIRTCSLHPSTYLSVIIRTAFSAIKVAVPMHPSIGVLFVYPVFGLPKLESGANFYTISVDCFVIFVPRTSEMVIGDAFPPSGGILFVDVAIVFAGHSRVDWAPIGSSETTHREYFAGCQVGAEVGVVCKYDFSV
jgi:hypothetical protein